MSHSTKKLTLEKVSQNFQQIHGQKYDYSLIKEYVNAKTKITIRCLKHDFVFLVTPDNHTQGKGCVLCAREKSGQYKRITDIIIDQRIEEQNRTLKRIDSIENGNSNRKIRWLCKICDYIWLSSPSNILNGGKDCPKCAKVVKLTNEIIDLRIKETGLNISRIGNVVNAITPLKWRCNINPEHEWKANPNNVFKSCGCPKCNPSKGENKIIEFLKTNNYTFDYQFRFKDCRYKNPLPFDFYLPNYNCCIEYQGEQHFNKRFWRLFGLSDEECETKLKTVQIRDQIKRDYCKENGLKLIEITYKEFSKIEEIILSQLRLS